MLSKEEIIAKLTRLGINSDRVEKVLDEMTKIVFSRAVAAYIAKLPHSKRADISKLSNPKEFERYITKNASSLPKVSAKDFEEIYNKAWKEYFEAVEA